MAVAADLCAVGDERGVKSVEGLGTTGRAKGGGETVWRLADTGAGSMDRRRCGRSFCSFACPACADEEDARSLGTVPESVLGEVELSPALCGSEEDPEVFVARASRSFRSRSDRGACMDRIAARLARLVSRTGAGEAGRDSSHDAYGRADVSDLQLQ